jgi:hypothetical protein
MQITPQERARRQYWTLLVLVFVGGIMYATEHYLTGFLSWLVYAVLFAALVIFLISLSHSKYRAD